MELNNLQTWKLTNSYPQELKNLQTYKLTNLLSLGFTDWTFTRSTWQQDVFVKESIEWGMEGLDGYSH